MIRFNDDTSVPGTGETVHEYLTATVRAARVGTQDYLGSELGLTGDNAKKTFKIYRPEQSVFDEKSMASFAFKPVTIDHPTETVTAQNWREHVRGVVGSKVARDGDTIVVDLALMDHEAIQAVKDGKRELSAGYLAEVEWTEGVTPEGVPYQGIQRNIIVDHLAVVESGRAGPEFRIGDVKERAVSPPPRKGEQSMTDQTKSVVLGDMALQIAVGDVAGVEAYKKQVADEKATMLADHKKLIEQKDGEIAGLKKKLEDASIGPAKIAELVRSRSAVVDAGKRSGMDEKEMEDMEEDAIKKKVVSSKMGDAAADAMSAAEIAGSFSVLAADSSKSETRIPGTDPLRKTADGGLKTQQSEAFGDAAFKRAGVRMKKDA